MRRIHLTNYWYYALSTFVLFSLAYAGYRILAHEALMREQARETLAQERLGQVQRDFLTQIKQKSTRLEHLAEQIRISQDPYRLTDTILKQDGEISDIAILKQAQVYYPRSKKNSSQAENQWYALALAFALDPSRFRSQQTIEEKELTSGAGWLIHQEEKSTALLYWVQLDTKDYIIFRLSYIGLLADLVNYFQYDFSPDQVAIFENGRLFYSSNHTIGNAKILASENLHDPLPGWQFYYYGQTADTRAIFIGGGILVLLALVGLAALIYVINRRWQEQIRNAQLQVSFVGQVSHELKTPLTNILLYTELLHEDLAEHETEFPGGLQQLEVIRREGERLTRLIQNVLTLTHLPKINFQSCDLVLILSRITALFSPSFARKGIALHYHPIVTCTIVSDPDRIMQIIGNFLSNAEKYACDGKQVDLICQANTDHIAIKVRDYGSGIADKELSRIFRPFYRISSKITEGVSGTGIGLSIAQQLAQALYGKIVVTPETPGVSFTLILPYHPPGTATKNAV